MRYAVVIEKGERSYSAYVPDFCLVACPLATRWKT
jgi:predicted RNase H-like HicB family nuclease